ncbi:MAG: protease complex subunit PrcB family protein [Clostridiaceae bacterium]|nr:protease complex subunit PrcB family protein [Clostridiaceae bacterium]MBW4859200.1 protease complex subunit PrcB family protein [Clostridiaceae bacterium]MBW4868696.1 protease complex subunit PrcB family protein [Clostridiaceae bacterium]
MSEKTIPFKIKTVEQAYSSIAEGIVLKELDDFIEISITKEFPTPGYDMKIKEIIEEDKGKFEIIVSIIPPIKDSILLQVITYKTILIEVDRYHLGNEPCTFDYKIDNF